MKQMKLNGSKFDNVLIDISSNEFMIMHQSKENRLLK